VNPCPVCLKDHDGPNGHFCAACMNLSFAERKGIVLGAHIEARLAERPQPKVRRSGFGARVYREDGHGCCERIHPTELKLLDGDRGEEGP
jgi:hypothetical protein